MPVVHVQTRTHYETFAVSIVLDVLTTVSLNMQFFWDCTSKGLLNGYRPSQGSYCLHLHGQTADYDLSSCRQLFTRFQETSSFTPYSSFTVNVALAFAFIFVIKDAQLTPFMAQITRPQGAV
jgi:hypothetical protein